MRHTEAGIKMTEEGLHYKSHLANTSSAFMLVCRILTLEHPVQIIKGFIDV